MKLPGTGWVRIALAIGALLLIGFLAWWLLIRPRNAQVAAQQAKVEAATSAATAGAAQQAVQIVTQHDREVERIHTITEGGTHAVQAAADAGTPIPAVAGAVRRSVCLFSTYDADAGCAAVRAAGEGVRPAGADAGSPAAIR